MAVTLTATPRTERGKNEIHRLRQAGSIPAVVYGRGDKTQALTLDGHELEKVLGSISVETTIIDLKVKGARAKQALIRELQYHPTRPQLLHVDFLLIHAGEKVHLEVPIRVLGTPVGVRETAGVLEQVLHALHIECLPADIPDAIDMGVEELAIGDAIHVRDLSLPGIKILNDADLMVCSVNPPQAAALPEEEEVEEEEEGAEPAVLGQETDEEEAS